VVLENVEVVYELLAEFDDYEATSTQVFAIDGLEFTASISKNHAKGIVEPMITFDNIFGGVFKMSIRNYPSNPRTQMISKEVRRRAF
jgi:hypothetical protein